MSQNTVSFAASDPSGIILLDTLLTNLQTNQLTNNSGTSRPTYAQIGTLWIDTTTNPWVLKLYTGSNDIVLGSANTSTLVFSPSAISVLLDTAPKLGGNLDVNAKKITSASNGNIILEPNGTGAILVGGNSTQPAELRFMEDSDNGTNYTGLKAASALSGNTVFVLPTADGTADQAIKTDASGNLAFKTFYAPGGTNVAVADGGLGVSSLTAYGPIVGGTTSTGAVQTTGPGTAGQFFGSNGASAVPTMQALPTSTTSASGIVELATNAETTTGTDTGRVAPISAMRYHAGSAKFWVNFNGTGTVATRVSNNVTSITDNGTGDYTINFTTAFSSANYVCAGMVSDSVGGSFDQAGISIKKTVAPTASALRVVTFITSNGTLSDWGIIDVVGFGTSA